MHPLILRCLCPSLASTWQKVSACSLGVESSFAVEYRSIVSLGVVSWYKWLRVHRFLVTDQLNKTRMTLSPRRNILLMNLSLLTPFALPLPFSVHISFTFSSTMLQCRSKALTRARSLRLFRHEMRTCVCVRVAVMRMESGPVDNS